MRAGKVAAFTVAGGQGSRLGFEGPKGCYPGGAVSQKPLFTIFAEGLRHSQNGGKLTREGLITGIESLGSQVISGFPVTFSSTSHAASKFVEMSMLTGDGRVRT